MTDKSLELKFSNREVGTKTFIRQVANAESKSSSLCDNSNSLQTVESSVSKEIAEVPPSRQITAEAAIGTVLLPPRRLNDKLSASVLEYFRCTIHQQPKKCGGKHPHFAIFLILSKALVLGRVYSQQ